MTNIIPSNILTINAGSSSVKFSLYEQETFTLILTGAIERIGMPNTFVSVHNHVSASTSRHEVKGDAIETFLDILEGLSFLGSIAGVGHRMVHGGPTYVNPTLINEKVLEELEAIAEFAPHHLPVETALVRKLKELLPHIPHVACFDTAFHFSMPQVAQTIPVPTKYREMGVRRYGFHGLSYEYLMGVLTTQFAVPVEKQRIILAHLGSGASLSAVHNGTPIDTTMSFTPNSGIPMGTRTGDVDGGIFGYFTKKIGMTPTEFDHMINYESGLLAVSGTTADMETLLKNTSTDNKAEDAVTLFAYQVRKQIGALAATMGGVDTLVFTGGIGERSHLMRSRIVTGLTFLGVELDEKANVDGSDVISTSGSPVSIYRIPANEEVVIAQHTAHALQGLI